MGSRFVWWSSGSRSRPLCCFFGCCTCGLSKSTCSACVRCAAACDASSDEWQRCSLVARNVHCYSFPTSLMASRVALTGAAANMRPIASSRRAGALRIYRSRLDTWYEKRKRRRLSDRFSCRGSTTRLLGARLPLRSAIHAEGNANRRTVHPIQNPLVQGALLLLPRR